MMKMFCVSSTSLSQVVFALIFVSLCLSQQCGLQHRIAMPIVGGKPEKERDSPWHVAIFNEKKELICGGTIIHELLVISAAHCFMGNSKNVINVDDFEVVVAKYTNQYSTSDNSFQKTYKIRQIRFSNSGYDGVVNYYQADIAILVLTEKIILSSFVLPACVNWETLKSGKRPSKGMIGKVAGWGQTEHEESSTHLRTIDLPVIDTIDCKTMVRDDFLPYLTLDKFCAGTGNHTGPSVQNGDSGGGILFVENGRYYLQGVVSLKQTESNSISLFTDLHFHAHTILEIRDKVEKEPLEFATSTTTQPSTTKNVKNSALIAQQQCEKYAEYRYVTASSNGHPHRTMDCVNSAPLIIGGVETKPKEYPHMALIGHETEGPLIHWSGAGSLISEKFILSTEQIPNGQGPPKWALLGDHDIASNKDDDSVVIYEITRSHRHPNRDFQTGYADIILYELNASVAISPYARPACLYTSAFIPVNTKASVTHWSRTPPFYMRGEQQDNPLQKFTISVLDDKICQKSYKNPESVICAAELKNASNADVTKICPGGAGDPLQVPVDQQACMWSILGAVSSGQEFCRVSAVKFKYTRVAFFLDWIQGIVWP